ncbi:unnamed protein product [Calicophoron daubneyi]|uniref:MI domain-containing protein n=1 Tax=Calicophoron daubneyi TaxID=300641 RepID=A0AAV2T5D6_CALDB
MSDQQHLHHPSICNLQPNAIPNGRVPEAQIVVPPYYVYLKPTTPFAPIECSRTQPQNARIDGLNVPANTGQMPTQFFQLLASRGADHPYGYPQLQPQQPYYCTYGSSLNDPQMPPMLTSPVLTTQLQGTAHGDFPGSILMPNCRAMPVPYHQVEQSPSAIQSHPNSSQPPTNRMSASQGRAPRKILPIMDPKTHEQINLESMKSAPAEQKDETPKAPPKADESPPVTEAVPVSREKQPEVVVVSPPDQPRPDTDASKSTEIPAEVAEQPSNLLLNSDHVPKVEDVRVVSTAPPTVPATKRPAPSQAVRDALEDPSEPECSGSSDESDGEELTVRRYDRNFILGCRNSPIVRIQPRDLQTYLVDVSRRKKGVSGGRHPRIIRLPTGITVKRVENAFVPSHLRKKETNGEVDNQKLLSRELNVILNRVSDGNLLETVADIKKQKYTAPEDLQLLAKLIFQKAIRQCKYSKVFASLCKHLKGFDVQGSEKLEVMVLRKVQEMFETPLDDLIAELNVTIDSKIAAAKDEAIKRILEDDRETNIVKKQEAYFGNITLLGEMYLCRLVSPKTMAANLQKLKESTASESLNSMMILLKTCGQELEKECAHHVKMSFDYLETFATSDKIPTHQSYKIRELLDYRARGYKELDLTRTPAPQQDASRRPAEEKPRWPFTQPPIDPKRKPAQSINPLTPSSLAVTQQSYESRKLMPSVANWSQGSGQLLKNADQSHRPGQHALRGNVSTRSREASPRVPAGPQGAWANPLTGTMAIPKYEDIVKAVEKPSRSFVNCLSEEETYLDIVRGCKEYERCGLLHSVFDKVMDAKPEVRNSTGLALLRLQAEKLITPNDLISACKHFFEICDEDWLCDFPKGLQYISEILQNLIQEDADLSLLMKSAKQMTPISNAAVVLAECLKMAAARLGTETVAKKWKSSGADWSQWGISQQNIQSFTEKHSVTFSISDQPQESRLKELMALADSASATHDQIVGICRQLSTSNLHGGAVRNCTRTWVSKSKGYSRDQIDRLVIGLGILVDHNANREHEVLQGLQDCSKTGGSVDLWRSSLVEKKVLSSEALKGCANSSSSRSNPVAKSVPT